MLFRIEPPPVSPGDVLSDGSSRYTITSKIGLGNYSSVWLAQSNQPQEQNNGKLVAIKILHKCVSTGDGLEMALAKGNIALNAHNLHRGLQKLLFPSSTFDFVTGGNSTRPVFLFKEIYGPSIYEFAIGCPEQRMKWKMGKRSIRDIISGLEFLHLNGIGHGDLHTRNILLIPHPPIPQWEPIDVAEYFGSKPVDKAPFAIHCEDLENMRAFHDSKGIHFDGSVVIADFGSAYRISESDRPMCSGRSVTVAPERLCHDTFDLSSDIWSLGCAMVEILTGKEVWRPSRPDRKHFSEQILHKIQVALDMQSNERPAPAHLFGDTKKIEEVLEEIWPEEVPSMEKFFLETLIKDTFKYEPSERILIGEVAQSAWLRD